MKILILTQKEYDKKDYPFKDVYDASLVLILLDNGNYKVIKEKLYSEFSLREITGIQLLTTITEHYRISKTITSAII